MKHLEKLTRKRLGELLLDDGLISKSQLEEAERLRSQAGSPLGAMLVESRGLTDWDLAKAVATHYQLPFADLDFFAPTKDSRKLLPEEMLVQQRALPLDQMGKIITLAVAEMPTLDFLEKIEEKTGFTPFLFVSPLSAIRKALGMPSLDEAAMEAAKREVAAASQESNGHDGKQGSEDGTDWASLFDAGNEAVLKEIENEP